MEPRVSLRFVSPSEALNCIAGNPPMVFRTPPHQVTSIRTLASKYRKEGRGIWNIRTSNGLVYVQRIV